jgi:uncharacterized protein with HEPN domain
MSPDDAVRIRHMIEAIDAAQQFIRGRTRSDLDRDLMLLFALVRAVEIVGEAATKISAETRARWPSLPWAEASGMRNRLVHAYFDINRDILWNTVADSLPALRTKLNAIQGET